MKRNKINKKACANCGLEAAVARKVCAGCDTPFIKRPTYYYESKDKIEPEPPIPTEIPTTSQSTDDNGRRRTERVKREKPQFYDSSVFTKDRKKSEKSNKVVVKTNKSSTVPVKNKKEKTQRKVNEIVGEDENFYDNIVTPHKKEQLSIILEELNLKQSLSSWRPG